MLFPMTELCFAATPKHKCLFSIVNRIKYTLVADIVDYFKNVHKMSRPIECTSMATQIAMKLSLHYGGCTCSLSMLYGRKAIRLPNPGLQLYSGESLTLQFDWMREARHSFKGPPHTHG
jgi:hypothetical protein